MSPSLSEECPLRYPLRYRPLRYRPAEECPLRYRPSLSPFAIAKNAPFAIGAHSKKVDNHCHSLSIHYVHYNFARMHEKIHVAPAMEAGVSRTLWGVEDIVRLMD